MKQNYLFVLGMLATATVNAQLDTVTAFNQVINDIKVFDNKLFIVGGFTQNQGATCYWSAYYDGSSITRQTSMIGGSGARKLEVWDNDLYHVGALQFGSSVGVGLWTGSSWTDGGSTNYSHSTIYADGNDLYVESDNGVIRKKSVGGNWTTFYDFSGSGGISSMIRYNGRLIVSGSFTEIGGVAANNIAQWDGSNWAPLGTGLNDIGGTMEIYNNELYVTGSFTNAGGVTVNKIARWNGTSWSDVGGGLAGATFGNGFRDLMAYNGNLYAVGRFNVIGGSAADDLAIWNGTTWTGVNYAHPETDFTSLAVYNNQIYIGSFDFTKSRLYRYLGGVGVSEQDLNAFFTVSPNPSNGFYTIESTDFQQDWSYSIVDAAGREIQHGAHTASIDISTEQAGMYFLHIRSGASTTVIKLMKQ